MTKNYSISQTPPADFHPSVEVASCYCSCRDKILLLLRHPQKQQGSTWGVPAGKLEKGEDPRTAVIREIHEEVGLDINDDDLRFLGTLYCRLPHVDYVYHMFHKGYQAIPELDLGLEEHTEARWVTILEAIELPLIIGGKEALDYYEELTSKA